MDEKSNAGCGNEYSNIEWYCIACLDSLNTQDGFSDDCDIWECFTYGYLAYQFLDLKDGADMELITTVVSIVIIWVAVLFIRWGIIAVVFIRLGIRKQREIEARQRHEQRYREIEARQRQEQRQREIEAWQKHEQRQREIVTQRSRHEQRQRDIEHTHVRRSCTANCSNCPRERAGLSCIHDV